LIRCHNTPGSPPLRLEREKTIISADIEHGLAGEILGQMYVLQLRWGVVDPRGDDSAAQIDAVKPGSAENFLGELFGVHSETPLFFEEWHADYFIAARAAH
jgi:hypothetical protein